MKSLILLLIAMSAAGTFPFIIYMALSTIFYNYISARFRYRCLKYCLLLYLVPFPLLKYFIYHRYFSTPKPLNGNVVISLTGKIVGYVPHYIFQTHYKVQQKQKKILRPTPFFQ